MKNKLMVICIAIAAIAFASCKSSSIPKIIEEPNEMLVEQDYDIEQEDYDEQTVIDEIENDMLIEPELDEDTLIVQIN